MTSRPPLGVQQRQPQRTLSGSGLSQRPATHQRSLSQQFLPSSPIRKETFPDFASSSSDNHHPTDVAQARYGAASSSSRRGGSRLKLELSSESVVNHGTSITESPGAIMDSSKPFTPSRIMMPLTDASDLGDMSSPGTSTSASADLAVPLPMPKRRQRFALPSAPRENPPTAAPPAKKDSRPKPYSIETPPAAPHYLILGKTDSQARSTGGSGNAGGQATVGHADFFPWSGNHPEDQFTEFVIKNGYFDKAPVAQTETASAKTTLFQTLKHKSGCNALSTIFTGVLTQRRFSGQITSASTFKPPPRVTLTDTKREVWLKDLANPAISLRRLSRTIPHGIRGKVLLDQCLNKNVPTDRAVWLAKCVGANEIRAFKRKGVNGAFVMGGEAKWIRDWTVFVEQFVDSVISAFGDADWKAKVNYAIRLATHLYAEYLMDREHYMEWLVSSLENSLQSKLPMWMLITQIYWKDLLRLRRFGRRLVTALLSHLHVTQTNFDRDILLPLSSKLSYLLSTLVVRSPPNFVSPSTWFKYRETLKASLPQKDETVQNIYKALDARNEQLVVSSVRSQPALRHTLIKHLDSALHGPMPNDLPLQCWNMTQDKPALARTLLEWCTSVYRPGVVKIFVAACLLRSWSTSSFDVTGAIFEFLDSNPLAEQDGREALYFLVSELVRSGHFSVPQYFQWLIARGGLSRHEETEPEGPCATRLLVELPIRALTESQRSIRANMLGRVSFQVYEEAQNFDMAIRLLKYGLGMPLDPADPLLERKPVSIKKLARRIALSSRNVKTELGSWLQQNLAMHENLDSKEAPQGPEIPAAVFNSVRLVLESAEDFTMLAEMLKSVSQVSNVDVLASCVDTVNRHLLIFTALGVARDLFDGLLTRLRAIAEVHGILARPLLASLSNLAPRVPGLDELAGQLSRDLAQSDRSTGVDACSPVSDNMAARLQDDEGDLHEEIEKLLTNGTSLDRNTMDRLFETIVTRLISCWDKAADRQRAYSALLARLRIFDSRHFDGLMVNWIRQMRSDQSRPSVLSMFPVLVCVGCLSISTILAATTSEASTSAAPTKLPGPGTVSSASAFLQALQGSYRTRFTQEVLRLITEPVMPNELLSAEECYRFCILQDQGVRDNLAELLLLVRNALAEYSVCRSQNDLENLPLDNHDSQDRLLELLKSLVLRDTSAVAKALAIRISDLNLGTFIDRITTRLLLPTSDDTTQASFEQVLELTNEFTLPFCQLKLSLSLTSGEPNNPDTSDRSQSAIELFIRAVDNAIDAKNITWTAMLTCLSPEITHHLKNRAQARFLSLLPTLKTPLPSDPVAMEQNIQRAENLVTVIDTIVRGSAPGSRPPQLVPAVVDKLADMWELLAQLVAAGNLPPAALAARSARSTLLTRWLPLMLSFVTLHAQAHDPSKAGNEVRARAAIVLAGLLQDVGNAAPFVRPHLSPVFLDSGNTVPAPEMQPDIITWLTNRIFDLIAHLTDSLADDARLQCVRAVRDCSSDPRLRYLFGFAAAPGENLVLAHREGRVGLPSGLRGMGGMAVAGAGAGAAGSGGGGSGGSGSGSAWGSSLWALPGAVSAMLQQSALLQQQQLPPDRLTPFVFRRWEVLNEPTPNVGENDTSLNLMLFEARKVQ